MIAEWAGLFVMLLAGYVFGTVRQDRRWRRTLAASRAAHVRRVWGDGE